MVHKTVSLARTPVTLSTSHDSAIQFVQDLAQRSCQEDSFFVADLSQIQSLVEIWNANLPRVRPFYALRCNSDELLLRLLSSYPQIGFYCSSRKQQELALEFVSPSRIFYEDPNWTRNNLIAAHSNNVHLLGFDCEADLCRMSKNGITNKIVLNVRVDEESALGCDTSKAGELLQLAFDLGLDCVGVSLNLCTQRLGLFDSIIAYAAQLLFIGRSIGLDMKILNLGGGFPSPLLPGIPSFDQICQQINISLDYYFPQEQCPEVEIIVTPGRYFVSSVFTLATRIIGKLETDASQITNDDFDAGQRAFVYKINEGYFGPFGCRVVPNCEPECQTLFSDMDDSELFYGAIHGPMDEDLDVVQKQCQLRQLNVGEWLLWRNMGSYTHCCDSLDDDPCDAPRVYYFFKEGDWKFVNSDLVDDYPTLNEASSDQSDEESELSEDSAIELLDSFWTIDWQIV